MKKRTYLKRFLLILAIFTAFPIAPSLSQPLGMGVGLRPWRGEARCWKATELNLSQEQAKGIEGLQQTFFRETQLFRTQIFAKRLELRELLTNSTSKIEVIRAKFSEIQGHQVKLDEKSIDYLIKVRSLLTQEQLKNWCPELEFLSVRRMMLGLDSMAPLPPRRPSSPEGAKPE